MYVFLNPKCLIALVVLFLHGSLIWVFMTMAATLRPPEVIPVTLLGTLMVATQDVDEGSSVNAKSSEVAVATPSNSAVQQEQVRVQEQVKVQEPPRVSSKPLPQRQQNSQRQSPPRRADSYHQPSNAVNEINAEAQSISTSNASNRINPSGDQATSSAEVSANNTSSATQGGSEGSDQAVTQPSYHAGYLNNRQPTYPSMSRKLGEEGRVILHVLIAANGSVRQINIKASSGYKRLDESALSAVKKWQFVPAKRGGVPIEMWYDVPINFSLNG